MMSLLDELKSKLDEAKAALETERFYLVAHQSNMREHEAEIADLERAIAALEPAPEAEPEPMHSWESAADEDSLQEAPDQPEQPQSETADETPEPVATLPEEGEVKLLRGERLYFEEEGWVPVDEFEFPKSEAIVECRWDDGFCETFEFVGYTPATNEPHWRSTRYESTEADQVITHYRSFAKAEQPQGPSPVEGEDWIECHGGGCPVAEETWVEVRLRNPDLHSWVNLKRQAENFGRWTHTGERDDIVAYRLVPAKPAPVPSTSAETETVQGEQPNPEPVGETV